VTVGTVETVTWTFDDRVDHDVRFDDGPASPIMRTGTWSRTFDQPGTYHYDCSLHPNMTGTVEVSA
jgi:plastocyanin